APALMATNATAGVIAQLGFEAEIGLLRDQVRDWIHQCSEEVQEPLRWQFDDGNAKYFRPLTMFSCYRAIYEGPIPQSLMRAALVLEMFHNVSLIVDDILDESDERRGKPTLHCRFGLLPALMTSGYIVADGYRAVCDDPLSIRLLSELLERLGVAECAQWRLRRQPLGVDDWRGIAGEDTGSMFEICACLATRTEELRRFGGLLGVLYHGCDDVGDCKGLEALGGGGIQDLNDGILTLPVSFAIRDPRIRSLFCGSQPTHAELDEISCAMRAELPEAEAYLDRLAEEAKREARTEVPNPDPLFALVDHTRQLSMR
ncbi:MAG: polyprenyl synthetase family protein, partial [Vicinamibacterales bacterium]